MSEQFSYPEFHLPLSQVRENSAHPRTPSRRRYEAMLKAEAERAKVSLKALLGRSNRRKHCYARFRVWRELREMGCSYTGIGQTAGRHHASILLGIRRIEKVEGQKDKPDEIWMDARVAEHVEKAQGWGPSGDAWDSRFWIFEAWERRWRDEIISHELAQLTRVGSAWQRRQRA